MTSGWLKSLSHKAVQVKILHPLYNASLGSLENGLNFNGFPPDLFGGDAGRGRWVANGSLDINGLRVPIDFDHWYVGARTQDTPFFDKLHGFEFCTELKSLGGDAGRKTLRHITEKWLNAFENYNELIWSPTLTSSRLVNWMIIYPYAFETASDDFQDRLHASFYKQYMHLRYHLTQSHTLDVFDRFACLWAMVIIQSYCTGLADDVEMQSHLQLIQGAVDDISLDDGGLVDRNPRNLIEMAKSLLLLKYALRQNLDKIPLWIDKKLDMTVRIMSALTHHDKDLSLFQGATLNNKNDIEKIIKIMALRIRRQDTSLSDYGYSVMRKGRTSIVIDHGHQGEHVSPLAFEMGYASNRIVVNCGAYLKGDQAWRESLTGINAHSTLSIENIEPKPSFYNAKSSIENVNGASLFVGSHEGYSPDHSMTHTRRIFLDSKGEDLRGEDLCVRNIALKPVPMILRFHLHPLVRASMIDDHSKILIRLPTGSGWVFQCSAADINLEDSVFCGDGFNLRKSQQICVSVPMDDLNLQLKWAFKRQ
jgi:uncharacterized heparinase superfamily protein